MKTLLDISDNFSGFQKLTILENVVGPIPSLQAIKNQADQFKTQTGTNLTYEKCSEFLLSAATTHYKKFKRDTKFGYNWCRSVYELEQLPNDGYEDSF